MSPDLTNQQKAEVVLSLQRYFREDLDSELSELQAGFFNAATAPPQLEWLALKPDPFVVCLPAAHPLAAASSLRVAQLAQERFVMFERDVAPANFDNVVVIFSCASVYPRTCHAARQWLTILAMVANEMGISVVPKSLTRTGALGIRFIPLDDPAAVSPAVMAWNPSNRTPALDTLVACARDVLAIDTLAT